MSWVFESADQSFPIWGAGLDMINTGEVSLDGFRSVIFFQLHYSLGSVFSTKNKYSSSRQSNLIPPEWIWEGHFHTHSVNKTPLHFFISPTIIFRVLLFLYCLTTKLFHSNMLYTLWFSKVSDLPDGKFLEGKCFASGKRAWPGRGLRFEEERVGFKLWLLSTVICAYVTWESCLITLTLNFFNL